MESSVRVDGDDPTKGVDSFLDGANMSLASFEPSLQIIQTTETIELPSPTNNIAKTLPPESPTESETRTPPLTIADLAGPARRLKHTNDDVDESPLARQNSLRQPAPVIRRNPSTHRALSFRIPEDDDKLEVPEAILRKLEDSDVEDNAVENTKGAEGDDTIGSLPFPANTTSIK